MVGLPYSICDTHRFPAIQVSEIAYRYGAERSHGRGARRFRACTRRDNSRNDGLIARAVLAVPNGAVGLAADYGDSSVCACANSRLGVDAISKERWKEGLNVRGPLDRLRLRKLICAIQKFLARTIQTNPIVPAWSNWNAVGCLVIVATELDRY